jgi:histone acetyltransferase (RNA polymerase elongator complex component)
MYISGPTVSHLQRNERESQTETEKNNQREIEECPSAGYLVRELQVLGRVADLRREGEEDTLCDNGLGLRNLSQEEGLHFIWSRRICVIFDFFICFGNLLLRL